MSDKIDEMEAYSIVDAHPETRRWLATFRDKQGAEHVIHLTIPAPGNDEEGARFFALNAGKNWELMKLEEVGRGPMPTKFAVPHEAHTSGIKDRFLSKRLR
jgi:hypothetical protein